MNLPNDRRYTPDHVWVRPEGDHLVVGITEHAQEALGSIEMIDLPVVGSTLSAHRACGSVESLKTVSDLVAPLDARVAGHNATVCDDPGMVNEQPYGDGWLMTLADFSPEALHSQLDADGYAQLIDG